MSLLLKVNGGALTTGSSNTSEASINDGIGVSTSLSDDALDSCTCSTPPSKVSELESLVVVSDVVLLEDDEVSSLSELLDELVSLEELLDDELEDELEELQLKANDCPNTARGGPVGRGVLITPGAEPTAQPTIITPQ